MKIAVIGAGVSGIAAAKTLRRFGYDVVVLEKTAAIGGIWAATYPGLTLQNLAEHYHFSDFPWPCRPDRHPTADQVRRYLEAAVAHFGLDIRTGHEVVSMAEAPEGWTLTIRSSAGESLERFDFVVVASGHYSEPKPGAQYPGQELFGGVVVTEREFGQLGPLKGKRVTVVGFGKTAVDLATFAAEDGAAVTHLFRAARWLLPRSLLGIDLGYMVPSRLSTRLAPSWVHPHWLEATLHRYFAWGAALYWRTTELAFRAVTGLHPFHLDPAVRARLRPLEPGQRLTYQMRATVAQAPVGYFRNVIGGRIEPVKGDIADFDTEGVRLGDGKTIAADIVILAVGSRQPTFAFLPEQYRALMTTNEDGTQLYRHLLHPAIPRLAFVGFNHGYFHIPATEVASLWIGALIAGDLELPSAAEIEERTQRVADWKRAHILLEPNRAHGIGMRIHQYLDVLLGDLGVRIARKRNPFAEAFVPYWARDYAGVADEYLAQRAAQPKKRKPLPFDT